MLKKIAITGGLASGKSTVCLFLKELGAHVISADKIVHKLLTPNTTIGKQIVEAFGQGIIKNQSINKPALANIVFSNPDELKHLEQLLHPAVADEVKKEFDRLPNYGLVAVEIPLLFESGMDSSIEWDAIVAVTSKKSIRETRYCKDEHNTSQDFQNRVQRQLPSDQILEQADFNLSNNGSKAQLKEQVVSLYKILNPLP